MRIRKALDDDPITVQILRARRISIVDEAADKMAGAARPMRMRSSRSRVARRMR